MKKLAALFIISSLFILGSCGENGSDPMDDPCVSDFDQKTMFANYADHLILPAYKALTLSLTDLETAINNLSSDPNHANLTAAQATFLETYEKWQYAAPYEFGPAASVFLRNHFNNFPLNIEEVENNIAASATNFSQPDTYDKGLPALDYLLFYESHEMVLNQFTVDENATQRKRYIKAIIADMKDRLTTTLREWEGDYRQSFINNAGTADGSSLSLIINQLNQHFEGVKRESIGIPSGVYTLSIPNPERVEGYFSGHSSALVKLSLQVNNAFFLGKDQAGTDRSGLDDFLRHKEVEKEAELLVNKINKQYEAMIQSFENIETPFSKAVGAEQTPVDVQAFYNEVSRQVIMIKTDMPSSLCVSITYIDNPSDSD